MCSGSVPPSLGDRLHNWARYVRDHPPHGAGRCASAEGRFVRERLTEADEEDRRTPVMLVDPIDGELVDEAWRRLEMRHRRALKWHYVEWRPAGWIMRRLGRPKEAYRLVLGAAKRAMQRELDARQCAPVRFPSNSISMTEAGERVGPSGGPCAPREKAAAA